MKPKIIYSALAVLLANFPYVLNADTPGNNEFRSETEKNEWIEKASLAWQSVTRWMIEYQAVPSMESSEHLPVHRTMAIALPGDYYHCSAHFPTGGAPWQADPFTQETFIHQGTITHEWPFNQSYEEWSIKQGENISGSTWSDVLWLIIPKCPLTDYKIPPDPRFGTPVILIDTLKSPEFRLLAKTEMINGEDCAIFDNGRNERIWIAKDKDICLMRHDFCDPSTKNVVMRILTDKLKEFGNGLWLPEEYRIQFLQGAQNQETLQEENRIKILNCVMNNKVPGALFIPSHPPGSILYFDHKHFRQVSAGGTDSLLPRIVEFLKGYVHLPSAPLPKDHSSELLAGGLACGLIAGFCFRKTKKEHGVTSQHAYSLP